MFSKKAIAVCTAAVAVVGLSGAAQASPFMNITFGGDTAGSAPGTTTTVVDPIVQPYAIGGYTASNPNGDSPPTADSGTILVNDVGAMSKAAVLTTNPANGELGALWIDTEFGALNLSSQQLTLSFDVQVIDAPTSATAQPKTLNGSGSAGIFLGVNTYTSNGWAARFAIAPTSAGGGVFAIRSPDNSDLQSFFNYSEGQVYHVSLVSDYNTGKVATYVDNTPTGEFSFWNTGAANVSPNEVFFHLNGEIGNANSLALDNIVTAVPEPSYLGLAGMAASALLLRRRRRPSTR